MTTDGYQQMRLQPCSDARQKLTNSSEIKLCCHSAITPVPSVTVPIYDESGKIAFAIANFADITPCNQPEQLLAEYNRVVEAEVKKRTQELLVVIEQLQSSQQELIKRQQASEQASFAKSEFLANMSHELRTPLNAILGFTQIMSHDHTLSTENQQNLEIINRAGEHLLNLINDILDISKIEAGRTTLNLSNFDLLHLLDNVQKILQSRATAKGLQLKFEYAANLPRYIQTDASKLRQILLNILSNAIKFTASGSVTLRVKLGTGDKQRSPSSCFFPIEHCSARGQRSKATTLSPPSPLSVAHLPSLIFEIQDTGMGIAPQELDLLFEAFRQTESGRKSQQGTGLGLVISRKYVQLMGEILLSLAP
jgi:signal transduction histidine kinase